MFYSHFTSGTSYYYSRKFSLKLFTFFLISINFNIVSKVLSTILSTKKLFGISFNRKQMQRPLYEETWDQITYDYHNLQNLAENSVSIRNFAFKCQEIVNNKLTMDREYYKSAKRFLLITKLLNIQPEIRIKLIRELLRILISTNHIMIYPKKSR